MYSYLHQLMMRVVVWALVVEAWQVADFAQLEAGVTQNATLQVDVPLIQFNGTLAIETNVTINGPTILDGGHAHRLFIVYGTLRLSNLTAQNGFHESDGGAVTVYGRLEMLSCVLQHNYAGDDGGVVYADDYAEVSMLNCVLEHNSAGDDGGVVQVGDDGVVSMANCVARYNQATDSGGVVRNNGGQLMIVDSYFEANYADTGGCVLNNDGNGVIPLRIVGSVFTSNAAGTGGGSLRIVSSDGARIEACTFRDNVAAVGGGGINMNRAEHVNINATSFVGNSALDGGALYVHTGASPMILTSCHFENNSATNRGGVWWLASSVQLVDCSLVANSGRLGGVFFLSSGLEITIENSTISQSRATYGGVIFSEGARFNLISSRVEQSSSLVAGGFAYALDDSTFSGPSSWLTLSEAPEGAAVYVPAFVHVTVSEFWLVNSVASSGGALFAAQYAQIDVHDVVAEGNTALSGAALYLQQGASAVITNTTFARGHASQFGGALAVVGASCICNFSTFEGNTASSGGAVVLQDGGSLVASHTAFQANVADSGGGIFVTGTGSRYSSGGLCTYDKNIADSGGVCLVEDYGEIHLHHSDSGENNTASGGGGGVAYFDSWTSPPTIPDSVRGRAVYGDILASSVASIVISHEDSVETDQAAFDHPLRISAYDMLGHLCTSLVGVAKVSSLTVGVTIGGSTTLEFKNGVAETDEYFRLALGPGENVTLLARHDTEGGNSLYDEFTIKLRECIVGEVRLDHECRVCSSPAKYSVDPTQSECEVSLPQCCRTQVTRRTAHETRDASQKRATIHIREPLSFPTEDTGAVGRCRATFGRAQCLTLAPVALTCG